MLVHLRSIKALQTQSMSYRTEPKPHRDNAGYQPALCINNWTPKTCQWIEGTPNKMELRRHGADRFKCMAAVKPQSSYCEEHYARCWTVLTPPEKQAR